MKTISTLSFLFGVEMEEGVVVVMGRTRVREGRVVAGREE
jgi:hypothetical protein